MHKDFDHIVPLGSLALIFVASALSGVAVPTGIEPDRETIEAPHCPWTISRTSLTGPYQGVYSKRANALVAELW